MQEKVIVKELTRKFGTFTAVDNISMTVHEGEVLGFLGPNGAGKTTAMRVISGFLSPTSGSVSVCGFDVVDNPIEVKKLIGYMPEGSPAYGDMTPLEFLNFIAEIRELPLNQRKRAIENAIDKAKLEEVLYKPIETLSKGYTRRVGLAQAILHDPAIMILDEPTEGLDPNQKYEFRNLIKDIEQHKSIIISTHILEEVEALCSRAVIIDHGKIMADDTMPSLLGKSQSFNAICIVIDSKDIEKTQNLIRNINNISRIETKQAENETTMIIYPQSGKPIAAECFNLFEHNQINLKSFFVEKGKLDEVFRATTFPKTNSGADNL